MEERTPQEEIEYRRYLRKRIRMRKRRRKVMIARGVVAVLAILLVTGVYFGIRGITKMLTASDTPKQAQIEEKETPIPVDIPEGYEDVYQGLLSMEPEYPQVTDILMALERYPKELLELLVKNPETIDFVTNYLKHVDDVEANGEITREELQEREIPLFLQWDERWGYVTYGSNLLAISGCGPTCMSMVYTGLTKQTDKTPADMAEFCLENNYYSLEEGTSWNFMLNGARNLGLTVNRIALSKKQLKKVLKKGETVICSMKPGDFTTEGHFIVLYGLTEDGNILLNDPNNIERSNKEWDLKTVYEQVKAAWSYSYQQ